ncbi:MAG: phage holin family protein [Candidatus Binatia bacterium]
MTAENSRPATAERAGFFQPLKAGLAALMGLFHTRLDLILTEIEEEGERLRELVLLVVLSLFCLSFGVLLLTLFIVVIFWDTHRLFVLGGFAALYLGVGLIAGQIVRKKIMARPKLFSATLSELAKDVDSIKS